MRSLTLFFISCLCWAEDVKVPPEIESADKTFQQECQAAYNVYQKALKVAAGKYKDTLEKKAKPALVRKMDTDGILVLQDRLNLANLVILGEDIDLGIISNHKRPEARFRLQDHSTEYPPVGGNKLGSLDPKWTITGATNEKEISIDHVMDGTRDSGLRIYKNADIVISFKSPKTVSGFVIISSALSQMEVQINDQTLVSESGGVCSIVADNPIKVDKITIRASVKGVSWGVISEICPIFPEEKVSNR